MKQILMILLLTLSVNLFAQDSTSIKATEVERIVDKYTGKAVDGFNAVVDKIAPTAEKGFEVAVKLQVAKGVTRLLPIFGFLIFLGLFNFEYNRITTILNNGRENGPERYDYNHGVFDEDNCSVKLILYLVFACILFILTLITTASGILHLMAPEWYAIEDIINLVK